MKIPLNILATLFTLAGVIFFLQGINIIPGSYMTGDPQWAIRGAAMVLIGIGGLFWMNRRK